MGFIGGNNPDTKYINRGDPVSWDFVQTDFIADNEWHDLDLSDIVPEGVSLIRLHMVIQTPYIGTYISLRETGKVNNINKTVIAIHIGNVECCESIVLPCNNDRTIQYRISAVYWQLLWLSVGGWFEKRGGVNDS